MGRKPTCGHSFVRNPGLDLPMAKSVTEEPPRVGFPRPYQAADEVYEEYLQDLRDYNARHGTKLEPLPNPYLNTTLPPPPFPVVTAWESREDAYERYRLQLAEYNAKYGTMFEPVTDCW